MSAYRSLASARHRDKAFVFTFVLNILEALVNSDSEAKRISGGKTQSHMR